MADKKFTLYEPATGKIRKIMSGGISAIERTAIRSGLSYIAGEFDIEQYAIIDGVPVKKSDEELESELIIQKWIDLRLKRDGLLSESDWTQVPDAPLTEEQKAEWRIYRQKLRDLPANTEDPRNVIWPTKPSG